MSLDNDLNSRFMLEALACARESVLTGRGGPFGAVVVRGGEIIGRGGNRVVSDFDPTAHAEVMAIRDACRMIENFSLEGSKLYTTCEPCPMCLASIYWSRIREVFFACDRFDAARIGFDDEEFYIEMEKDQKERSLRLYSMDKSEAIKIMEEWYLSELKVQY